MIHKWENREKSHFGTNLIGSAQFRAAKFVFKNLAASVTRYYGQLSWCTMSEKINDPILRKVSDYLTDGWTDRQIDKRCYIECCPTNVERPKYNNLICRSFWIFLSSWISIIWLYVFGFKEQLFPTIMCKILWIYYVSPKILFWSNGLFKLIQYFIQHYENSCWMKC